MSEFYDLVVIGAGPAGMEAAITAAENGVKTAIIDSNPGAGGQYYKPLPGAFQVSKKGQTERNGEFLTRILEGLPVTRIYDTLTWGIFKEEDRDGWLVTLYGPAAPKQIHARTLVLANGAYDSPVAFPGWTLPGVITCGASLILVKNQRTAPGKRVLITGTGPLLLSAAAHLIDAGVEVAAVCEASHLFPRALRYGFTMLGHLPRLFEGAGYTRALLRGRTPYKTGWSIVEARGKEQVESAVIGKVDKDGYPVPGTEQVLENIDTVICGYGLTPNTGLARMIGCKMEYRQEKGGWVPVRDQTMQTSLQGVYAAGDGAGIAGAENARLEGRVAGAAAALQLDYITEKRAGEIYGQIKRELMNQRRFGELLGDLFTAKPGLISLAKDDTIICRCEEITLGEIKTAIAEGARTIGEVKMVTRVGMGNCQGRICERLVAGAIVQALAQEKATFESAGAYSIRPPLHPLPVGFLAEAGEEQSDDYAKGVE
ncbi:MAG: FAD-dependent oxidoreductase [Chloroflexi bacterium]|nr:MAG: FAD-dependent oxidoreductase [Chloroflexota bacterium]